MTEIINWKLWTWLIDIDWNKILDWDIVEILRNPVEKWNIYWKETWFCINFDIESYKNYRTEYWLSNFINQKFKLWTHKQGLK